MNGIEKSGSNRRKFLARIDKVKSNFNSCTQGKEFWENTEPMWNRMTQCLIENFSDVKNTCLDHEMLGSSTENNLLLRIVMHGMLVSYLNHNDIHLEELP